MFRHFGKQLTILRNVQNNGLKIRLSSTAAAPRDSEEYNHVKLIGTIITQPHVLANGTKSLVVRTVDQETSQYCNHQVNVKTEDPLSAGVRVYVFGNLSTRPFKLDDGRVRQRVIVKSKYFRLRGHADNNDHNSVVLLATICSEIRHTEKYTLFTLLSTHIPKSEVVKEEFHRIIVYDQSIIDVVRNSIQKFDRVHVEGKIAYMRYQNAGKTLHGGFIVANHIHKVN